MSDGVGDENGERDFLAEAKASSELALAMARISSLTASATASLASLQSSPATEALSYASDPGVGAETQAESASTSSSSSSSTADYAYPDMSKYYTGSDYAASLPEVGSWSSSSSSSSSYSSGFSSLFASSSKGGDGAASKRDEDGEGKGYASTPAASPAHGRGVLRRCYLVLAVVFVALLVLDQFQTVPPAKRGGGANIPVKGLAAASDTSKADGGGTGGEGTGKQRTQRLKERVSKRAKQAEKVAALKKVMVFGRHGASPGRFDQPKGLVLVRNRFLFVADFANKRLQMLFFHDDSGSVSEAPAVKKKEGHHHHHTAADGSVAVSGQGGGEGAELLEPVFEYALEMDQVGGPWSLCSLDDYIFVAEWGMHRIKIVKIDSKTGALKGAGFFGQFGYVDEPGKFNHPRGVAVHARLKLLVVSDENDHLQVLRFTDSGRQGPTLTYVSSFGRGSDTSGGLSEGGRGEALGFFRRPCGLAIHPDSGLVFVADSKNHRIQTLKLTEEGDLQPVAKFGSGGGFTFKNEPEAISLHPTHPLMVVTEQASQCLHEIMLNPGGHLSLRRSHCGKICSSSVSGSGGLRISGSRAAGPTSVLLVKDMVLLTAGDQVSLLKWKDWVIA